MATRYRPAAMQGRSDYGRNLLVPLSEQFGGRFASGMAPAGRVMTGAVARAALARGGVRELNRIMRAEYGVRSMLGS